MTATPQGADARELPPMPYAARLYAQRAMTPNAEGEYIMQDPHVAIRALADAHAAALVRVEALEELVRLARNRCCGAHPCADCLPYEKALTPAPAGTQGGGG